MNREEIEKNWNHLKNQVATKWNKLTSEDIYQIDGMYEKFVARIAKRYNYTREIAEREIENWQPKIAQYPSHTSNPKNQQNKNWQNPTDWKDKKRKAG